MKRTTLLALAIHATTTSPVRWSGLEHASAEAARAADAATASQRCKLEEEQRAAIEEMRANLRALVRAPRVETQASTAAQAEELRRLRGP